MAARIDSFRDLKAYQAAFDLQQRIFLCSKSFPKEERYSLTDQVRRASRSIGANVAEAWQKRRYPAHFVSKLTDADGEVAETEHWIDTAWCCEYIDQPERDELLDLCRSVGRMLGSIMKSPSKWCGRPIGP